MGPRLNDLVLRGIDRPPDIPAAKAAEATEGSARLLLPAEAAALPPGDWHQLAKRALVPAPAAGAEWAGLMLAKFAPSPWRVTVLAARDGATGRLIGIAPLERPPAAAYRMLPVLRSWWTPLTFAGTPLIDASSAVPALRSMLRAADREAGAKALLFRGMEADGGLVQAIANAAEAERTAWAVVDAHERAALTPQGSSADWRVGNISRKRRKELNRLRIRLAEAGRLESLAWRPGMAVEPWLHQFLALERAGWKGRAGTAIACDPRSMSFVSAAVRRLAERGEIGFWKIALVGRPVAMLFAIIEGGRAWLIKIAYDEGLARYSPGVLVLLDATEDLFRRGDIVLADSCAQPGHPMIDNIWRGRIAIADVLIATPGTSAAAFAAILAAERLRLRAHRAAKRLYHRLMQKRR